MRYKTLLSYRGTAFFGWQKQQEGRTVQGVLEDTLSRFIKDDIQVVGCGRTDSGVHASNYAMHFDTEKELVSDAICILNKMLPNDLAIHHINEVDENFHVRFDAKKRSYAYYISKDKNLFAADRYWHYPSLDKLDHEAITKAAQELLQHKDFYTFCKTHSDVETYLCDLSQSSWEPTSYGAVYRISANRFLRGMVRLIVGMLIRVGEGRIPLEDVIDALHKKQHLEKAYSAPACGLFLEEIVY